MSSGVTTHKASNVINLCLNHVSLVSQKQAEVLNFCLDLNVTSQEKTLSLDLPKVKCS